MATEITPSDIAEVFLQVTLLELFMSGIYTALFFVTVYAMFFKAKLTKESIGLYLAVFLMYTLSTIHVAMRWLLVKTAFIDNGDSIESTASYLLGPKLWMAALPAFALTMNTLTADSVLIWRCWIIWNRDFRVVFVPALCTIAGGVLGFLSVVRQVQDVLDPSLNQSKYIDFATPYFSLSLVTTVLATLLIILRLVLVMRMAHESLRGYRQIIEMLVESATLYSVTLIIYLPLLVQENREGSLTDGYLQAILAQMTGIAPTLIVARVSLGLSRPNESWHGKSRSSTIVFNSTEHPASTTVNLSTGSSDELKEFN